MDIPAYCCSSCTSVQKDAQLHWCCWQFLPFHSRIFLPFFFAVEAAVAGGPCVCVSVLELQRIWGSVWFFFYQTHKILAGPLRLCVLLALLLHSWMLMEVFCYFSNILKGCLLPSSGKENGIPFLLPCGHGNKTLSEKGSLPASMPCGMGKGRMYLSAGTVCKGQVLIIS